ncbi:hypothetical protein Y032_0009g712 [Ancylostoma ceylanicum]|uniref:Apple domain-containing protein n=1 Tax=Ancylostoma ceylanicum TaxID=53326 RepID=A0A016VK49_9BILA|nr:hypothetical protein Y032_0009g712 [Ancylostoma ceylanicum]
MIFFVHAAVLLALFGATTQDKCSMIRIHDLNGFTGKEIEHVDDYNEYTCAKLCYVDDACDAIIFDFEEVCYHPYFFTSALYMRS